MSSSSTTRSNAGKMFPDLPDSDFDREPHRLRGDIDKRDWKPQNWPFHISTLPRLPRIENPVHLHRATTHRSWVIECGERDDPEPLSWNPYETVGDSVLGFWCVDSLASHGMAQRSHDMIKIRNLFISNNTLSYLAWSYRLNHLARHKSVIFHPPQKLLADMFEAWIGAAWIDHCERGEEAKMIAWLRDFFHPRHWDLWEETVRLFDNQQVSRDEKVKIARAKTEKRLERERKRKRHSEETSSEEWERDQDRQVNRRRSA